MEYGSFSCPYCFAAHEVIANLRDRFGSRGRLMLAIVTGLVVGKMLGILGGAALAVRLGIADKPDDYSWRQLAGAAALAGIGFTMSLYIAAKAFPEASDFAAAKIAVFIASFLAACVGTALLAGLPGFRRWRRPAA